MARRLASDALGWTREARRRAQAEQPDRRLRTSDRHTPSAGRARLFRILAGGLRALFRRRQREGVWTRILAAPAGRADAAGLIRPTGERRLHHHAAAHQHTAGALRHGALGREPPGGTAAEPGDHRLGRSRGGLSTKVHLPLRAGADGVVAGGDRRSMRGCPAVRGGDGRHQGRPPQTGVAWGAYGVGAWLRSSASMTRAPCLSSGSLPLPHFGDWMHDGHPDSHSQAAMASRVACSQVAALA